MKISFARYVLSLGLLFALSLFGNAQELQRLKYNQPDLSVDLGVGLWAWPLPCDYDDDGDIDLVVSCPDYPYNGIYLFENPGGDALMPVFKPPVRVHDAIRYITPSYPNGFDEAPHLLSPGFEWTGAMKGDWKTNRKIDVPVKLGFPGKTRANQWSYVDYDGDGDLDLIAGVGVWEQYGWADAYNEKGEWTNGPLHGYVFLAENLGKANPKTGEPIYAKPVKVEADGAPVDVYGMPSPNFADFDGDGDLDLLCGDFLDGFTYFANEGSREKPVYSSGREIMLGDAPLDMPLCMIVVTAIDWDRDGDVDLVVGQEDGRVALLEHTGKMNAGAPAFSAPRFFQQQADELKFGALVTPVSFDWDDDGDEDLICGNTAGEIGWFENLDGGNPPKWAPVKLLHDDKGEIRIMAGVNGSIQGPAETKWGYTTIAVADWDHDGLQDIVANSIWGKVVWYRNVGKKGSPKLTAAEPLEVQWLGKAPKPAWNWWEPEDNELATQWRTTPLVADWNDDGINDLIMLDHEGYLALYERMKEGNTLKLMPGKRIFQNAAGEPLRLNSKTAGGSGRRKLTLTDWNGDGRLDLIVNSRSADLMLNLKQTDELTQFADPKPMTSTRLAGHTTSPTTVIWSGKKRALLIGAEDGMFYWLPR